MGGSCTALERRRKKDELCCTPGWRAPICRIPLAFRTTAQSADRGRTACHAPSATGRGNSTGFSVLPWGVRVVALDGEKIHSLSASWEAMFSSAATACVNYRTHFKRGLFA